MKILYNLCAGAGGYIADAVVAVIMLVFVLVCAKKGFITCFFGFISTILALFIAVSFAKGAMELTGGFFGVRELLEEKWIESFSKMSGFNIDISGQDVETLLKTQDLPAILITAVLKNHTGGVPAGTTLAMLVGETTAQLAATLITGIVLFIVTKLLLKILKKVFNTVSDKIGLIGAINKLLGAIVGLVEVLLVISLVTSVLTIIPSEAIADFFNSSLILSYLYNHNPLFVMIGWFL